MSAIRMKRIRMIRKMTMLRFILTCVKSLEEVKVRVGGEGCSLVAIGWVVGVES